ncbi:Hypothetical protein ETEE_3486 [Edwardsiella anguillarum ET080813]|uniref:Uncharacterized protein n=1 Tax=Edwardsiella anguillarum ET080813 TaxID=667120 RepID=A0A076LTA1_9GAMM|nr:Hypothetical protein ETEE_3486 [Edwardsiella anguillarum ET080813]
MPVLPTAGGGDDKHRVRDGAPHPALSIRRAGHIYAALIPSKHTSLENNYHYQLICMTF